MSVSCLDSSLRADWRRLMHKRSLRHRSLIDWPSVNWGSKQDLRSDLSFSRQDIIKYGQNSRDSTTTAKNKINLNSINYVQLYKPIYVAQCSKSIKQKLSYDEGDEFEFLKKIDDDYMQVIHLRTGTECIIYRSRVHVDYETPLRLGTDARGVVQRCLLQHNVAGAYLIRRSQNEPDAFVLSISQISNQRSAEDWHYLIRIDPSNKRFYFVQESKLNHLSFASFRELIRDRHVLDAIPLSSIVPFRIEFDEDLWHIPRRQITLEYRIGKGEFGEVWRASWQNGSRSIPVAVKKLHPLRQDQSMVSSFVREIETLKILRNNYIVAFYGVAADERTTETFIVTELMEFGDLKNWLKSCRDTPKEKTIISYAHDICRGMVYLEQRCHVHRDLACRNLLLGFGAKTVKIADFGLSKLVNKEEFVPREEAYLQKIPIRWTAPEALSNQKAYSIKADVWSFGIVLIEMWLKGIDPYPEEKDFNSVQTLVQSGYVHRKPVPCSNQFYNRLILPCLCYEAQERPSFKSFVELLAEWSKEKAEYERWSRSNVNFSI